MAFENWRLSANSNMETFVFDSSEFQVLFQRYCGELLYLTVFTRTAVYMRTYLILYFKDLYLRLFEFRLFFLRSTNFACKNEFPLLCRGISSECKSLLSKPYWTFYSVTIDRLLKKSCLVSCEHGKYRLISVALALPERC